MFLKIVAPYFPELKDWMMMISKLCTPTGKSAPPSSVTELPSPEIQAYSREPRNRFRLPPLSTITSGRNLARLISDEPIDSSEKEIDSDYGPRGPWDNCNDAENPFQRMAILKEVKISRIKYRGEGELIPPGDHQRWSDLDNDPTKPTS